MKSSHRRARWLGVAAVAVALLAADWFADGPVRQLILGSATIAITTEPAGAAVSIDGEPVGVTPIDVRVAAGRRVVRLQHRFHPEHVEALALARGDRRTLEVRLEPAVGELELISNPKGAAVVLDGQRVEGETPLHLTRVATGTHTVRLELPQRTTVTREIDVLADARATLRVELERVVTGTLTLQTTPSEARVEIEGSDVEYEPGVALPLGEYRVAVSAPGHTPVTVPIEVRAGRNLHTVALDRTFGTLVVMVEPAGAEVTVTHGSGSLERTEAYRGELRLPTGRVTIRARAVNHRRYERQIDLGAEGTRVAIRLDRIGARAGDRIRDRLRNGAEAPLLIVVGPGEFTLGATAAESAGAVAEGAPSSTRRIRLLQPFAIGVYEVTRAEYAAFAAATGAAMRAAAEHETARHPVVHVDRDDAIAYTAWLSRETGERYRLPSEAEWEFAARGGGQGRFGYGDDEARLCQYANLADASARKVYRQWDTVDCDDGYVRSAPVGTYRANAFGLYDLLGNVGEWVSDCWHGTLDTVPADGSARNGACASHVVRGGSCDSPAGSVRVTSREPSSLGADDRGFRIVREF